MKISEMEKALADHVDCRQNIVVPNVYWGFTEHECDLIVMTKSGYLWEIEIKTSKQDLLRDQKKKHGHRDEKIKFLYFAIPQTLLIYQDLIPERAGIITLKDEDWNGRKYLSCQRQRFPLINSNYKLTDTERFQIARLGALRIWDLKRKLNKEAKK